MKAIATDAGGALLDETKGVLLPFVFKSKDLAEEFLLACERVGTNLYAGMLHSDLKGLFDLWFDAFKRPSAA